MYSQQRHSMQSITFLSFIPCQFSSSWYFAKYSGLSSMGQTSTQRPHLMQATASLSSFSMAMMPLVPLITATSTLGSWMPIMGPPIFTI